MGKFAEIDALFKRHNIDVDAYIGNTEAMLKKAIELEEKEYKELVKVHPQLASIGEPEFGR
tara:strand:+ start:12006 stop:12188 length:183 start_codon:yes stop_codon:yes gene_type:complete